MQLDNTQILTGLVVLVVVLIAFWLIMRRRRSAHIRSQFGPEFERTVSDLGDERKAETVLAERQQRVAKYTIKPLATDMKDHFLVTWREVQAKFVDDPKYAVTRADDLLGEVMVARGYPMSDFEQRTEDLSVDHPKVVQNYRAGHAIAVRHSRGEASTEDLRTAMIHYRDLLDELVAEGSGPPRTTGLS